MYTLPDAGMTEDSGGVRRSSRVSIKPLEYWRNEHKRYGREFKSLTTILGIETRTPNSQWPMLSTGRLMPQLRCLCLCVHCASGDVLCTCVRTVLSTAPKWLPFVLGYIVTKHSDLCCQTLAERL